MRHTRPLESSVDLVQRVAINCIGWNWSEANLMMVEIMLFLYHSFATH